MPTHLRVFISSPGDVSAEREIARRVLRRLPQKPLLRDKVTITAVTWDDPEAPTPMSATETPQHSVVRYGPPPSDCDLTIVILWGRMGTRLPATELKPDQTVFASGTEWEYENARRAGKEIFVYFRQQPPQVGLDDPLFDEKRAQYLAVRHFRERFKNLDGSLNGGVNTYSDPGEFERLLERHLESFVGEQIGNGSVGAAPPSPVIPEQIDLTLYRTEILKRFQRCDLEGLTPPEREEYLQIQLRSVFTEPTARENAPPLDVPKDLLQRIESDSGQLRGNLPRQVSLEEVRRVSDVYYEQKPVPVFDLLGIPGAELIVLLGDPGSGKSTLGRYVVLSLLDDAGDSRVRSAYQGYLPVLIELRSYVALRPPAGSCQNLYQFIDELRRVDGFYPSSVALKTHLAQDGRVLFIFDGLDEIFVSKEREEIAREIRAIAINHPRARIICTSRLVGYRRKILVDAGFRHWTIQDFTPDQVKTFLQAWFAIALYDRPKEAIERRERITDALEGSLSMRSLSGNPLLLTILAIIGKTQDLPRERWRLYEHAAAVLVHHWDVNRHLRDNRVSADHIDEDDKKELLRRLAYRMQAAEGGLAGNYIHKTDLANEFEEYLRQRYDILTIEATRIARVLIQQLHERNFILAPYGTDIYGFVHRGFLEYFCAASITHRFEKTRQLSFEDLKTGIFRRHCADQTWHEVLRLVAGTIDERFTGDIVTDLCAVYQDSLNTPGNDGRSAWPLAVALQCFAEVKRLGMIAGPAKLLLGAIVTAFDRDMSHVPVLFNFLKTHVVPHLLVIGRMWPERAFLGDLLRSRTPRRYSYIYDRYFGSVIGAIGGDDALVYAAVVEYLSDDRAEEHRVLVSFALALGWHDNPQTFPLLLKLARTDRAPTVRYSAIYALAEHFHDRDLTEQLLRDKVSAGEHQFDRVPAISGLAKHYFDRTDVLTLLISQLNVQTEKFTRTVLVQAIGEYFGAQEEAHKALCNVAIADESPTSEDPAREQPNFPREAALHELVRHWPTNDQTLAILGQARLQDPTPWLREWAGIAYEKLSQRSKP